MMWSENEQSIVVASDGGHRPICGANELHAAHLPRLGYATSRHVHGDEDSVTQAAEELSK